MSTTPPTGRAHVPGAQPPGDEPSVPPVRASRTYGSAAARAAGPAGNTGPAGRGPAGPPRRKIRPRWGRIALVLGVIALLIMGGVALTTYLTVQHYNAKLSRIDAYAGIPSGRPAALVPDAENILLLGSDSRDPSKAADQGGWRTDTIILMHVTADHSKAYMVSIPRDTWTYIPKSPTKPQFGNVYAKINAAFSWGGVPLTVETVEKFTGVRIDHVVLINFGGFDKVTDALGGVDMYVDQTITSIHKPHRVFTKGNHHFNGAQALDYIRQRYQFANGDFTRVKHQQAFLKAIVDKAASSGTITSPSKLQHFIDAMANAIVVDKQFDLGSMVLNLHGLRSSAMTFLTSPSNGTGTEGGQSVVEPDKAKDAALYEAVAHDRVAAYLQANPS